MKKSFTLIELLIYISLAMIILNVSIYFIWQMIESKVKVTAKHEVQRNVIFVLEKISYEAKRAKSILIPQNQGEQSNELILRMPDNLESHFYLLEGKLVLERGPVGVIRPPSLTSQKIKVDEIIFKNLSAAPPGIFQVRIKMSYLNPYQRKEYQAEVITQQSINLRDNLGETSPPISPIQTLDF